jgi:signal transduction histidine kinase
MSVEQNHRPALVSWVFVSALGVLSLTLGALQYRWIGEVSRAETEQLKANLQENLRRLSREFNSEVAAAIFVPVDPTAGAAAWERASAVRFSGTSNKMLRSVSIAKPSGGSILLLTLDPQSEEFKPVEWPSRWIRLRDRLNARLVSGPVFGFARQARAGLMEDYPELIAIPHFGPPSSHRGIQGRECVIVELNLDYIRSAVIPELLQRYLGTVRGMQYQAEILLADDLSDSVFSSGGSDVSRFADGSVRLLEPGLQLFRPRLGAVGRGLMIEGSDDAEPDMRRPPSSPDRGRWILFVRHQGGSLDLVVERTRLRNLAVTTGILLLLIGAAAALVRYARRAQRLAELQMQFVAGVSHELRTPLTVMRTAGHNLQQAGVAFDPKRVERYGALIAKESEKLTAMVEQVLRFSNAKAGRAITTQQHFSLESVIEEALEADRRTIEEFHCYIEKDIDPHLPALMGDRTSVQHALQNLINNAAKYGQGGEIGISARLSERGPNSAAEIRIRDQGLGIPPDEIVQIFDPFYRGKQVVAEQIRGTGLGLSLAKTIIEAHGGSIAVNSKPGHGTEFIVRLPATSAEQEHDFAHSVS